MLSFLSSLSFVVSLLSVLNVVIVVVDGFQSYSQQYNHHHHHNRRIINPCQQQQQQQRHCFPRHAITSSISVSVSGSTNDNNNDIRPEQDLDNNESDLEYILRLKEYSNNLMTDAKTGDYLKQDAQKEDDNEDEDEDEDEGKKKSANNNNSNTNEDDKNSSSITAEKEKQKKSIGKYVSVEEWDAEQRRRSKGGELSWEERTQFEGQRDGNKYKQNDILRKNLY